MTTVYINRDKLLTILANGQWFAGFKCRWRQIGKDRYRVTTNYLCCGC